MKNSEDSPNTAFIETQFGRLYINGPVWHRLDIAHSLSQLCRFTGHTRYFFSVAQHSLLVSHIMEERGDDPLEGLLHDAHESLVNDLNSPIKAVLPEYKRFEGAVEKSLRRRFDLPEEKSRGCIQADWMALFIEAAALMPSRGVIFSDPWKLRTASLAIRDKLPQFVLPHLDEMHIIEGAFMARWDALQAHRVLNNPMAYIT